MREWREKNNARAREISRAGNAKFRATCPDSVVRSRAKDNDRMRADILSFFGGACARCGVTDARVLQMDHKDGGGIKDREKGFSLFYRHRLIKNEPEVARFRFQLLCANCNWIKRAENREHRGGRPRKSA